MWSSVIWLGACVAMVAAGVYFVVRGRRLSASGRQVRQSWPLAEGRVLELRTSYPRKALRDPTTQPWYMPVVEYTVHDGRSVQAESLTGGNPAPARVGDIVPVRYDPADPTRVVVDKGMATPGRTGTWFVVLGCLFLAFALCAGGCWGLLVPVMGLPLP